METAASSAWKECESYLTEDVLFVVGSAAEMHGPSEVTGFYRKTQETSLRGYVSIPGQQGSRMAGLPMYPLFLGEFD